MKPRASGPAHQQLHADPGAEAEAADPGRLRLGMDRLHPVERRGGVAKLADAVVEHALALADAAEVEAQGGEAAPDEGLVERQHDRIVHRAAALRVRVEDHRDRRARARAGAETAFETALGAGKDDFGHKRVDPVLMAVRRMLAARRRALYRCLVSNRNFCESFAIRPTRRMSLSRLSGDHAARAGSAGGDAALARRAGERRLRQSGEPVSRRPRRLGGGRAGARAGRGAAAARAGRSISPRARRRRSTGR